MPHPIHHITAIASDPKRCVDFYTRVLGLRLVKKTVNQDQTEAYHLFFGDKTGEPGMDLTFFTFPGVGAGQRGRGTVSTIALAVPASALPFWQARFEQLGVEQEGVATSFDQQVLTFYDGDGQRLQLVGVNEAELDSQAVWTTAEVGQAQAVRCFYGARLAVAARALVEPILTEVLGFELQTEQDRVRSYRIPGERRAGVLEIEELAGSPPTYNGAGTVHHIAFQVKDRAELLRTREQVRALGLHPTEVIDRYYFQSVYFRTPAGILFELATNGPGFTADEDEATLGQKLALPPFLEPQRAEIESRLMPL